MEFKEELRVIKSNLGVFTNKELAIKLGLKEDAVKAWTRKKTIPQKYKYLLKNSDIVQNGNNNIQVNQNNGNINIGHSKDDICELINKLSDKKKEYFYHLIKAEILKDEL